MVKWCVVRICRGPNPKDNVNFGRMVLLSTDEVDNILISLQFQHEKMGHKLVRTLQGLQNC